MNNNYRMFVAFLVGVIVATLLPLAIDWLMFNTITPCEAIGEHNNKLIMECLK